MPGTRQKKSLFACPSTLSTSTCFEIVNPAIGKSQVAKWAWRAAGRPIHIDNTLLTRHIKLVTGALGLSIRACDTGTSGLGSMAALPGLRCSSWTARFPHPKS